MSRRRVLAALLPALLALSCVASTGTEAGGVGDAETRARILELQRQARVAEVEIQRLKVQVAELQAALEARGGVVEERRQVIDAPPVRAPAPGRPSGDVEASDLDLDTGAAGPAVRTRPPALERAEGGAEEGSPVDDAGQDLYDRGYTLYHQERFVDAETAFQRFLQTHGATELADNALYWIGESRFARRDFQGALAAFRETVERYPRGNKVPDALLKVGDCLVRVGDREGARQVYDELVRRFPATAAATIAGERRDEL